MRLVIRFFVILVLGSLTLAACLGPWPPLGYPVSIGKSTVEQGKAFVAALNDPALSEDGTPLDSRLYRRTGTQDGGNWQDFCTGTLAFTLRPEWIGCGGYWQALGPSGQAHDAIRTQGGGRYSVWHGNLYFSAPDAAPQGGIPAAGDYILWVGLPGASWASIGGIVAVLLIIINGIIADFRPFLTRNVQYITLKSVYLFYDIRYLFRDFSIKPPSRTLFKNMACYGGLCLLGFILTGSSLRVAMDWVEPMPITTLYMRSKIDWYRQHRDEIDTIFLGTSRVMRGIDIQEIDRVTAERGCPTHSFNFAVDGQSFLHALALLEEIKTNPPKHLRHLLFEPRNNGVIEESLRSTFLQHFMSWKNFIPALRDAWANPNNNKERWDHIWLLVEMYLYHKLGIGLADQVYQDAVFNINLTKVADEDRGFIPFPEIRLGYKQLPRAHFDQYSEHMPGFPDNENGTAFKRRLADWIDQAQHKRIDGEVWAPVFAEEFTYLDRIKAQKFALMPPSVYPNEPAIRQFFLEKYPQIPVLFPDLLTFPAIYNLDYWYDDGHLNHIGAKLYSQWVAEHLCQGAHP